MRNGNDRKLLELAAKASRYEIKEYDKTDPNDKYFPAECKPDAKSPSLLIYGVGVWNPLDNDGDALRLAVQLKIDYLYHMAIYADLMDLYKIDPYAATRRTIVYAAAEIGKTL